MVLDVVFNDSSATIDIPEPFRPDLDAIIVQIERIAGPGGDVDQTDVRGLILEMIRGIAGCESGCPANAKSLVSRGYKSFDLHYIEGGILTARTTTVGGNVISLKMFPDF
jgi:hypothetical protein